MCIFARTVKSVAKTHIFVRYNPTTRRMATVYQMEVGLMGENAMILPIPGSHVEFVNLEDYPDFFKDMDKLFPENITKSVKRGLFSSTRNTLEVVEVGNYIASFVSTMNDWDRIDPIFRLKNNCWVEMPDYSDFGFVVFQLKFASERTSKFHPMAYTYNVEEANTLFFPTTHVHDGEVELQSDYDHKLYFQMSDNFHEVPSGGDLRWKIGEIMPSGRMNIAATKGLVSPVLPICRCEVKGKRNNADYIVMGGETVTSLYVDVRVKKESFGISDFAKQRHFGRTNGFTWTALSHEQLLERVAENWDKREPGQDETTTERKVVVPIDPDRVYGAYIQIQHGMSL